MKKIIKILAIILAIVIIVAGIFFLLRMQKKVKVTMYHDDRALVDVPTEYELVQNETVLLESYPALLTFKHGNYTINVVEAFDGQIDTLIENPNLIIAQSEVVNSMLTMSNFPDDDDTALAIKNAEEFKKQYENIYPVPEYYEVGNGYHRAVPYTDFGYFDKRLSSMFQGVITDVIELKNSYLCVVIYADNYDEIIKLNESEFQQVLDNCPQTYFEDVASMIKMLPYNTIETYNVSANRAEKLREDMEEELVFFESKLKVNPWYYDLFGTYYEQDGKEILTNKYDYDNSENLRYYTDDLNKETVVEE